jgi:hypothetical protein
MSHFDRKKTECYFELQKLDVTDCFAEFMATKSIKRKVSLHDSGGGFRSSAD